jgi:hypothetical protein
MKKILLLSALALALYSCTADKNAIKTSGQGLIGKWNLVQQSGGFTGGVHTPTTPTAIEFTADSVYKFYQNNQIISQSKFHTSVVTRPATNERVYVVTVADISVGKSYNADIRDTLLMFDYQISDGYTYKYARVK